MLNKILIPLDGSQLAERALVPGLELAQRAEAALIILRSLEPQQVLAPDAYLLGGYSTLQSDQSLETARKDAARYLKSIRERVIATGPTVQMEILEGGAAETIVEKAKSAGADLIVMSSHGYSGLTRWVLGSVAERVLHAAACPVLIVRSPQPIRHMLIPLDGSELSEQVLTAAFELAKLLQCKVTLLRAVQPMTIAEVEDLESYEPGFGMSFEDELHDTADDYLKRIAQIYSGDIPEIQTCVMHDSPAQGILDYAELHNVDVIGMSTHGRTGLQRWVYGSVTEKILRTARACSMLVVRPKAEPLPKPNSAN